MCKCLTGDINKYESNSLFGSSNLFNPNKPKPKYIDINDEKSLKDNNISYKDTISEFDEIYDEVKDLKERLEEEISDIINSRKQILKKIRKYFSKQHRFLKLKEKSLKSYFNAKVDVVERELNNFLVESNRIILSCIRISKEIKDFGEENKIKELYYICEINKNNEKVKAYLKKPIRNLEFEIDLPNDKINCDSYYFNGLPVPNDINVEENDEQKIVIYWKNDNYVINDFNDRYKIKYGIELKCGINKYSFETSEKKLVLTKYDKNANCKVRIKTIINDSCSMWSDIKEFKIDESIKKTGLFSTPSKLF